MIDSNNIHTVLLEGKRYTAGATPNVECRATNVLHRFLKMWVPLFAWSEVPARVIVNLNVAVVALTDLAVVLWDEAAKLVVELLPEYVQDQSCAPFAYTRSRYFNPDPVFSSSILWSAPSCSAANSFSSAAAVAAPSGQMNIPSSRATLPM